MAFEQRSKKTAFQNPYYSISEEEYTLPNGSIGTYYGVRGLKTVFIVPMLNAKQIIITKQFRYLLQMESWEFPAGRIDPGESPIQAARRELEEESGYRAGAMYEIGTFAPCNGLSDEICNVFLATDLQPTAQQLEETEAVTVYVKGVDEFEDMINNNTVQDGMTIAAWTLTAKQRNLLT